ncbi:MAG: class I SAM-dependent methyltransferase [Thermoanaerobaculia bacterium]
MMEFDRLPNQYSRQLSAEEIAAGNHREFVGGLWDHLGILQLGFLIGRGLRPPLRLLDLGCGCLRGGVHFVRYLEPGHYFGVDVNESLLIAGEQELEREGLRERLPPGNLLANGAFEGWRFGVDFDFVLAQSVFTHLPAVWLRHCLGELTRCVRPGGQFYVTYFECPADWPELPRTYEPHGGTTYPDRDPFHYRVEDLRRCAEGLPWRLEPLGSWGHPRGQHMALYVRE